MAYVHLIGNAHLDPVWLWRWQEGYAEVMATFRSALDRMNEFPDFVFTCAGAAYYAWVEETDPAMFAEIQKRVKEGRWVIVGGWWIQPDCNAPSGESFARQALYAQRYFLSRFGKMASVGYNVDSFGHNAMLPQILKRSGMDHYVFMRPNGQEEKTYPFARNAFVWEAPDGSRVKTFRIPEDGYGTAPFGGCVEKAERHQVFAGQQGNPMMCFYGVGNHGGGPTVRNLIELGELISGSAANAYAFSSPNQYFAELDEHALPVLKDELQHHASGCYTAVMEVKKLNRMAEARLVAAEKFMALAYALGVTGKPENLEKAWHNVLFNQFHDIMGGCSIKDAYQDARESYGESLNIASRALNRALQAIAWNIDTSQDQPSPVGKEDFRVWEQGERGVPFVVFNPSGWEISAPVETGCPAASVRDDEGRLIPIQRVRSKMTMSPEGSWQGMFTAKIPPMGWRTYWLYRNTQGLPEMAGMLSGGAAHLENDWLRAEFDPVTGALTRLYDKKLEKELLDAPARARVIDEEHADTWAHRIFSFRKEIGVFANASVELMECGETRAVMRIRSEYGRSELKQTFTMYREMPGLFISCEVFWREEHKMLKLCFPTPMRDGQAVASIPYGFLRRPADGDDEPMQGWVALEEDGYALGVATDSRAAYDAYQGELRINALRSPGYADHTMVNGVRAPGMEYTEQGAQCFELALYGIQENYAFLQREAERLTFPVEFLLGTYHTGKLSLSGRGIHIDQPSVAVTAFKQSEDGQGYILRLVEQEGSACRACISIPFIPMQCEVELGKHEIRTLYIADGKLQEVNLLER